MHYVAIGRIRAQLSHNFGLSKISLFDKTDFLSLPNDANAKAILLSMSLVTLGTELPRYTKLLTFSRSSPCIMMLPLDGVRTLRLSKLIFIPHFKQACCNCHVTS